MPAYADMDTVIRAINETGIYKFVRKPWIAADFARTIDRAIELRLLYSGYNQLARELRQKDALLQTLERLHPGITKIER